MPERLPARFISESPRQLLEFDPLYQWQASRSWRMSDVADEQGWQPIEQGARGPIALSRTAELDASTVHAVEVAVQGFQRGFLELSWAPTGQRLAEGGQLRLKADKNQLGRRIVRFSLVDEPAWQGTIGRMVLRSSPAVGPSLAIQEVAFANRQIDPQQLAKVQVTPWKVELDHEVRNALPAISGQTIERRIQVPENAALRLGYGVANQANTVALRFTARAACGKGSDHTLIDATLDPMAEQHGWQDATAELAELTGQTCNLALEVHHADGSLFAATDGLPFWAAPEVISRQMQRRRQPNVLLVLIDTLRADHMSLYGHSRPTTPQLDAWAAERSVVFEQAIAQATWTLPSHASLLSGWNAVRHGLNHDLSIEYGESSDQEMEMLAEILHRQGYQTGAYTGGAFVHPRFGFARGFDSYGYWPDRSQSDSELDHGVEQAQEWIKERAGEPFFYFLHTYAVHDPYYARQPYFDQFSDIETDTEHLRAQIATEPFAAEDAYQKRNYMVLKNGYGKLRTDKIVEEADWPLVEALYDSGIAYMDERIAGLLDFLDRQGLADDTLVIFTSDHGESLGEGGRVGHVDLTDEVLQVPLMLALPQGVGQGQRISSQVRLIDLVPTVLEALGIEPSEGIDGTSLLPLINGRSEEFPDLAWSYSTTGNRGLSLRHSNRLKYIYNTTPLPPVRGRQQLYDLKSDPRELKDLAGASQQVTERYQKLVREHFAEAAGLRLRLASRHGRLRGEIVSALVQPYGLETADMPCQCLTFISNNRMAFDLPPGTAFDLIFEKLQDQRLAIQGQLDLGAGQQPFRAIFELANQQDQELRFAGSWSAGPAGAEPPTTGFHLSWHGAATLHSESPAETDSELRRQLEALGYL